ncbi:MAG: class I SAM-dependent methyltransferase [Ferruginibacter sp.]
MIEKIKCIICNEPAQITVENLEGYQKGGYYNIYHCISCDTSFAQPHEINEKIYDHIYSQANITPGYNRYAVYAKEIKSRNNPLHYLANEEGAYFAIKEILETGNDKKIRILEVGSGLGYLTYAIRQNGYDITGLDISDNAVTKAKNAFGDYYVCQDVYQFAKNNITKFDIVILTEVIEHVPNPNNFIEILTSMLRKDGKLIITTPNKSVFSSKDLWETELPPVHLTWFSEMSFKTIAQQKKLAFSFFNFSRFNKKQIDITRFIFYDRFYRIKKRLPVLDEDGNVITPVILSDKRGVVETFNMAVKKMLKPFFILFLTNKKNLNRNNVLCTILVKQ